MFRKSKWENNTKNTIKQNKTKNMPTKELVDCDASYTEPYADFLAKQTNKLFIYIIWTDFSLWCFFGFLVYYNSLT